jgi:hypothetical protein
MDWAIYQPRIRFDAHAERAEYEWLFNHHARVLQDRLVRRRNTDRTKHHAIPEWEKLYQAEARAHRFTASGESPKLGQREEVLLRPQAILTELRFDWTAEEGSGLTSRLALTTFSERNPHITH